MTDTLEALTEHDLTRLLERDYRRQLHWYPRSWRAANGDALVGTLLDAADDADRFTMERGEWRCFAAEGIASRLDLLVVRRIRDAASSALLAMGAGVEIASLVLSSWAPWDTGGPEPLLGPFRDAGPVLATLWAVALVSALVGRWRIGRIALALVVVAALSLRPIETWLAPPHGFALDPGTLAFTATCAVVAALGRPSASARTAAITAMWAGLACVAFAYLQIAHPDPSARPTGILLQDPVRTSWMIALTLGVAGVLALAGFRRPAGTIVLAVVPATAALEAAFVTGDVGSPPVAYLLIVAPVVAGLVAIVVLSRRAALRVGSPSQPRRSGVVAAVAATLLVVGDAIGLLTANGLDWTNPAAVNWSVYWRDSTTPAWPAWATHPDASASYRLPSGGTCTIRIDITDLTSTNAPSTGAVAARDFVTTAAASGTLLRDADIADAIRRNPSAQNEATNFWGATVRYGRGTVSDNRDVEYFEAVEAGIRWAITARVTRAGGSTHDYFTSSVQRCSGEQE